MKLFPLVAVAVAQTTTDQQKTTATSSNICGETYHPDVLKDEITLNPGESCTYRIYGSDFEDLIIKNANFTIDCSDGDMWIVTKDEEFGPFCTTKRKRRHTAHDYNLGHALNKNYKTEEMDLVFRNGQSIRMKFAFQFEFEFQPGFLGEDGMCGYRDITGSNHYFERAVEGYPAGHYENHHADSDYNHHYSVGIWEQLTQSLYEFNVNYDHYRHQCQSYMPVHITCDALDWQGKSWKQMLVQIKALINAQCSQCTYDGICKLWNQYFDNIKHALDYYTPGYDTASYSPSSYDHTHKPYDHAHKPYDHAHKPYDHAHKPYDHTHKPYDHTHKPYDHKPYDPCDEDQCAIAAKAYKNICPSYSKCVNKCYKFACICNHGYTKVYGKCVANKPYQAPVYKPKPPAYSGPTYTGEPYEAPLYTSDHYKICPWWVAHHGDCGKTYPNQCSLKYFRVCGEHFFNTVYSDVCRWQDAKQLIPMFTAKLVPLGVKFEETFGECNGYSSHSHEHLYGRSLGGGDRDVAQCRPEAGAPDCSYLDFSHVHTARQFQYKMEHLYYSWLKTRCNAEWRVHFEALLTRMRNSLFCDDGSAPDHYGYTPSPAPPVYNHHHGYKVDPYKEDPYKPDPYKTEPYKTEPYKPDPYKTEPYKTEPYKTEPYKTEPYKPETYTPAPYKPDPYKTEPYKKPYKEVTYKDPPLYTHNHYKICPWWKAHYGDCGTTYPNRCSLKYFRVCGERFFNEVYSDVCRWQDAKQLIPMFTEKLVPLGVQFEHEFDVKCHGYGEHTHQHLYGRSLPDDKDRDVAQCKGLAGAVPCQYLDFTHVKTARDFQHRMEHLYDGWLRHYCNKEWRVHFEALLIRMRNSLFCDDGSKPDHHGYSPSPAPPVYKPVYKVPHTYETVTTSYNKCDINQCAPRFHPCPANAHCVDKCKGFSCVCHDGYTKVRDSYGKAKCISDKYRSTNYELWGEDEEDVFDESEFTDE